MDDYHPGLGAVDLAMRGSWNRFAYVQGDPINSGDPTGLHPCGSIWSIDANGTIKVTAFECQNPYFEGARRPGSDLPVLDLTGNSPISAQRAIQFMESCLKNLDTSLATQRSKYISDQLSAIGKAMLYGGGLGSLYGLITGSAGGPLGTVGGAAVGLLTGMADALNSGLLQLYTYKLPDYDRTVMGPQMDQGIKDCQDGAKQIANENPFQ